MYTANLKTVDGSVMLAVPPSIVEMLGMASGMSVNMAVESGRLVIGPVNRKGYSLEDLLAQSEADPPIAEDDRDWLSGPACGKELI